MILESWDPHMIFYVKIELKSKLHITDCDGSITHDKLYWTSKIKFFKDKKPIFKKIESYREEEKKKKKTTSWCKGKGLYSITNPIDMPITINTYSFQEKGTNTSSLFQDRRRKILYYNFERERWKSI